MNALAASFAAHGNILPVLFRASREGGIMEVFRSCARRIRGIVFTLAVVGLAFAGSAQADSFNPVPARTIGPYTSGQSGSWTAADDRTVGAAITGQNGWTVQKSSEGPLLDDEITPLAAHSGNQSLRVSNWFTSASVDSIISPSFAPVGESGATSGSGAPVTNTVSYSFWFRSASTSPDPGMEFTTQLSRLASYRLTYLAFLDTAGSGDSQCTNAPTGFHLKTIGITTSDGTSGGSVVFTHHCSPTLVRGAWYKATINATFNDGQLNDVIETTVEDSGGNPVWNDQSPSWEFGYAGVFNNYGPFAVDHVTFDLSASTGPGPTSEYAGGTANGTQGIYYDDMEVVPGGGHQGYATSFNGDRWVDPTGSDAGNDCATQASPCSTIAHAIAEAVVGNTIHIASGTYTSPLNVTKDGLTLVGEDPGNKPKLARFGGGLNQPLLVINGAKNVTVRDLEFDMDQSFVAEGILASGFVDGLVIDGNHFVDSRTSSGTNSKYSWRNAIAINHGNNSQGLPRVNGSTVSVTNNTIDGAADPNNGVFLRAGIQVDASTGTVSDNTVTAGVQDIQFIFATATSASSATTVTIDGNHTFGRGVDVSSPNGSVTGITLSNNDIHAIAGINDSTAYPADWSLVRLMHNSAGVPMSVSGNTFSGHAGSYRGVLVENFPGITFSGNTFTPAAGAGDFVSLVVSNKEITTDNPPLAPLTMSLTAQGNTFNGSGVSGAGTAVEFLNDNDAGGTASFGSLIFGGSGSGQANSFDGDLRWYFHLDDYNCDTVDTPCAFLDYDGAIGSNPGTNTEVRPFTGNVSATDNSFDGVMPSAMTPAQQNALQARTYDKTANSALGTVDYGLAATAPVVYVDDDYAAGPHSYGDPLPFTSSAAGSTTAYWQIDAFATIPDGVMHVDAGGTVYVAKGSYADAVTLNKELELIGDGNTASDTVVTGAVTVTAGGSDASNRLLLQTLRISNAAGYGVSVSSASYLAFDQVAFAGNGNSGLNFNNTSDDVVISDSLFDANASAGIRTSTTAQVSNVSITGSTFSNNAAGIILFGASGSGNGQITHWSINGSHFTSNDNADASAFGGGIWLKTGGSGSVIDDFSVTGSTFADNGSSNTLNQVGITVRARPGTTMSNVSICNNTFEETATPGTQLTGINVFDDTGNSGYQPIEVCASNTFSGLGHSVSGLEQHSLRGSQPVVNITGGSIANTEYINTPVIRVRDNATFPTISAAMNDAGTQDGDEIHAPAGLYNESVTVTHNGMTLSGDGPGNTVISGSNVTGNGVLLPASRSGVTLKNIAIQDFTSINDAGGGACIRGASDNDNTTISNVKVDNCAGGRAGIYFNGPVDSVAIDNSEVSHVDGSAVRGIVIWNGFKTNISITDNYVHDITGGCCAAIELQDGTASGVKITGNTIENAPDQGMGLTQLTSGAGPNLISGNVLSNTGRFGITLTLPDGTGLDSGDGSIVVEDNTVTRPASPTSTDTRDVSGIAVIRRAYAPSAGESDVTTGVVIRNNTVTGWVPVSGSPNDGFGIVVEGTKSHVYGNTVTGSDIGIQLQAGNDGYPGDSNQNATNDFFSRGNAQNTCVDLGSNTLSGNAVGTRSVSNPAGQILDAGVHNTTQGTDYCSIQAAIDAADPCDSISVDPGSYAENVVINKSLTLSGPFSGTAGFDVSRDGTGEAVISPATGRAVRVNADDVVFDGFTVQNVNDTAISSGANYGGGSDNVQVINNRVLDVHDGSALYTNGPVGTVSNWTVAHNLMRNIESSIGSGINLWKVNAGTITDNVVEDSAFGGIQVNQGSDVEISNNTISNTAHNGINVAVSSNVQVFANTITGANSSGTADEAGLTLYGGSSNVTMMCNSVSGSGRNGFSTASAITDPYSNIRIFDNAITVPYDISHNLAQGLVIGSNWYGGSAPSVDGSNSAGVQVADPLAATPIGTPTCNNPAPASANNPAQIIAVSGGGQSTPINTAFAAPLVARVVDSLGGAVMGESVDFTAPASGASAVLGSASGTTDYNGMVSTTATANGSAGNYSVTASSGTLTPASFALTNGQAMADISLDSGTLNATYDGNPHSVTATTLPAGLAYTVTYDGSTQAPTDAGSYAVVATIDDPNYTGSTSGTLVIDKATATLSLSDLTQTYDGSPKPVSVTTSPGGVAYTVTYDGSSTPPTAVGDYSVLATITDPNYQGDPASGVLHITEAPNTDVAVTITDFRDYAQYGHELQYGIVVSNVGNQAVTGVTVNDVLPAILLPLQPKSWHCYDSDKGTCNASSGSGDLSTTVDLDVGGSVTIVLQATVNDDQNLTTDLIENQVTVSVTGDSNSANDSATDTTQAVIFRDGFEMGGDGAQASMSLVGTDTKASLQGENSRVLDLRKAWAGADGLVEVARLRGASGEVVRVEILHIGKLMLVRLAGDRDAGSSGWAVIGAGTSQLALGLAGNDSGRSLILVGASRDLELRLADGDSTLQVWGPAAGTR